MSLSNALKYAQPGQTIFLKNGTYSGAKVERSVSGTADKNINLVAESLSTDGSKAHRFILACIWSVCKRFSGCRYPDLR